MGPGRWATWGSSMVGVEQGDKGERSCQADATVVVWEHPLWSHQGAHACRQNPLLEPQRPLSRGSDTNV